MERLDDSISVSVVILTKDAGARFSSLLTSVFEQEGIEFDVVVIDSGSTDETLAIAERYPVRITKIDPSDFSHGGTRNLAVRLAKGRYLVFLTHDAVPRDRNWLVELIRPLSDPEVAGVFARQVPRDDASATDRAFYQALYPTERKVWFGNNWTEGDNIFSNVSSAIRRDLLEQFPFDDQIILAEDYEWAKRVLGAGFKIVYHPAAEVVHSHSYGIGALFRRNFDIGESYRKIYAPRAGGSAMLVRGLRIHAAEIKFLLAQGLPHLVPYCVMKDLTRFAAIKIGKHSKLLPRSLRRWLSNYDEYWG